MSDLLNHGSGYKTRKATWYWRVWWWIGYNSGLYAISWWRQRRKHPKSYLLVGEPGYGRTYGPGSYHLFGTLTGKHTQAEDGTWTHEYPISGTLGPIDLEPEAYNDIYFGFPKWWQWRQRRAKKLARKQRQAHKFEFFNVLYGGDLLYEYDGRTLDGLLALREDGENASAKEPGSKPPSGSLAVLPEHDPLSLDHDFMEGERAVPINFPCTIVPIIDPDYSCGAAYCDDPACNTHGPRDRNDD